jgi:hypothetical protein
MPTNIANKSTTQTNLPALSTLRFARYSTYASYLSGNRAAYTTKTHIIGAYADAIGGHRVAKTLCNKKFSDMETHDGNGSVEKRDVLRTDQVVTCKTCAKELEKIGKAEYLKAEAMRLSNP